MENNLLIRKAITGNISEDELIKLHKLVIDQPELREDLEIEQVMYEFRNNELKKELKRAIPKRKESAYNFKMIGVVLLIAITLGFFGYLLLQTSASDRSPRNFAAIHLAEMSVSPILSMNDEAKKADAWTLAVNAYSARNFEEALQLINTINSPNDEQKLYAGLCSIYAINPDYAEANVIMKSLQKSDDNVLYDQALWYGALTDIMLESNEEAQRQLLHIVNGNLWKQNEAKELLRLLSPN